MKGLEFCVAHLSIIFFAVKSWNFAGLICLFFFFFLLHFVIFRSEFKPSTVLVLQSRPKVRLALLVILLI